MRKLRELQDGARYHVTARANRKEMILDKASVKASFLAVVRRAKRKYDFRIENFCIMGNHFHFIIQPCEGESLSFIMKWILGVFAMSYNRDHKLWGHVWGDRFFSEIIRSLRDYLRTFQYIDDNPIRAHQVQEAKEWRFGGLWHHRHGFRGIVEELPEWCRSQFMDHLLLQLR